MKMFEIWECVFVNDEVEPLLLVDRTDDIEKAKLIVSENKNYIIWDNLKKNKI